MQDRQTTGPMKQNMTAMCRTAAELISAMQECENPGQREVLKRFFKTGRGEYGEGDEFLGLKVPETRAFAKACRDLPLPEVETLLQSRWHEARLCGFLILVEQYNSRKATAEERDGILNLYLRNARNASNWDLVDLSCYKILGRWLVESAASRTEKLRLMDRLAGSDSLWEQRISIVSTMATLKAGDPSYTLRYARRHLYHSHDLMHKAVGWLLRETGKRCGTDILRRFLAQHAATMPRTALRYAIEKMDREEREYWMKKKATATKKN